MKTLLKNMFLSIIVVLFSSMSFADPFVIGSIGDSITKAFNATGLFDHPKYSWSTGYASQSSINSHYNRLKEIYGDVDDFNYARTGAVASELDGQVTKILKRKPDYVTVLMGANDICKWPEDHAEKLDAFTEDYENALERLVESNEDIMISVAPVPNMLQLWEIGDEHNCYGKWNFLRLCRPLLSRNVSAIERQRFAERWQDANDAIEAAASIYPDNVIFLDVVQTAEFSYEDLSRKDCFHPSLQGQNYLSEMTWQESWFAE